MMSEVLKKILYNLDDEELQVFQWFLQKSNIVQGFPAIPKSRLQTVDRWNTVDEMVQTYGDQGAVQVTRVVLEKIIRYDLLQMLPSSSSGPEGASKAELQPNTADTESDTESMEISSPFTPEMQTVPRRIIYRFRCTGSGVFRCAKTGLVFEMSQGAQLQYSIVEWDESFLKPAAGPLYDIRCSEDAAVFQIHFPHCETKEALRIHGLLSVAHFTENGMNILEPLQITDIHVVVEITRLSRFGLILDPVKRPLSHRVKGQVLLFLHSPKRGPPTLDVFLLQKNIPPSQVAAQQENAEYIEISADCSFISGRSYSLRCEQEGLKIQPERANFCSHFGPDFHPTFEAFLTTNLHVVTLIIQDQEETVVWKHDVHLKGVSKAELEPHTAETELGPKQMKGDTMTSEVLKNILEDLKDEELRTFQWFLQKPNNVQGLKAIPKSRLQTTNRHDTVDVMVQTYGLQRAEQLTRVVLEKISRKDLLQRFPASSSGPEDPRRYTEQSVQPQDWLRPVWTELIDRLSEAKVYLILDKLYQQKVFNAQEKNVIRAQMGADKARKLIEEVQQKGPEAVSRLKDALNEVDPYLFRNLKLP